MSSDESLCPKVINVKVLGTIFLNFENSPLTFNVLCHNLALTNRTFIVKFEDVHTIVVHIVLENIST